MSSPLLRLSPEARRELIGALESGRLAEPITEVGIQRYVGKHAAKELARELERLTALGLNARLFAEMLRLGESDPTDDRPCLVWTGPGDDQTTMRDTGVVVRELFSRAAQHVLVAGFAIYQGDRIFEELARRMEAVVGLEVDMYLNIERKYGDTTASEELVAAFSHRMRKRIWKGKRSPSVFYDVRALELAGKKKKRASLHAKCVVADREQVFVTSANFTEAAQERNIEVGLLVRDRSIADQLCTHFRGLVEHGHLKRVPGW